MSSAAALCLPAEKWRNPAIQRRSRSFLTIRDYPVAAGVMLIFADVYQFSPLKQGCLRHCRSPFGVIVQGWHDGNVGAFRMGCCWGLMLVQFVVGVMNLPSMVLLSAVIFIEKVVWRGPLLGRLVAVALIVLGILTLVTPILNRLTR
jgi:predicted metal-binding membrane protein